MDKATEDRVREIVREEMTRAGEEANKLLTLRLEKMTPVIVRIARDGRG